MKYFKTNTKKRTILKVFLWFQFVIFILFILKTFFILKVIIMTFPILINSDLLVNKEGVSIMHLLGLLKKTLIWKEIKNIKVVYRDFLSHGAFSPSYIKILTEDGKSKKVYYRPNKEELLVLKEIVESKEKSLIIINSPYIEYE